MAARKELYFDEIKVGDKGISPDYTFTEARISAYAELTGDFTPVHVDEEYAKKTPFGTRGSNAVGAICAALLGRVKSGRGQHIDLALYDCLVSMHEYAVQCYTLSGGKALAGDRPLHGNSRPALGPPASHVSFTGWKRLVHDADIH